MNGSHGSSLHLTTNVGEGVVGLCLTSLSVHNGPGEIDRHRRVE